LLTICEGEQEKYAAKNFVVIATSSVPQSVMASHEISSVLQAHKEHMENLLPIQ
jgi:hypothetical protein